MTMLSSIADVSCKFINRFGLRYSVLDLAAQFAFVADVMPQLAVQVVWDQIGRILRCRSATRTAVHTRFRIIWTLIFRRSLSGVTRGPDIMKNEDDFPR